MEKEKEEEVFKAKAAESSAEDIQSGQRQKIEYEQKLGPDRIDPETGTKVSTVEIYNESLIGWKGGIRIALLDGANILHNNAMIQDFSAGDDSWK